MSNVALEFGTIKVFANFVQNFRISKMFVVSTCIDYVNHLNYIHELLIDKLMTFIFHTHTCYITFGFNISSRFALCFSGSLTPLCFLPGIFLCLAILKKLVKT